MSLKLKHSIQSFNRLSGRLFAVDFLEKRSLIEWLTVLAAVLYFCQDLNKAIFVRLFLFLRIPADIAILLAVSIPLLLVIPYFMQEEVPQCRFAILYSAVLVYFLLTLWIHPQYIYFYFRPSYGIQRVFRPDGGIFAVLFLLTLTDRKKSNFTFKLVALVSMAFYSLQFIAARFRGYWPHENQYGVMGTLSYSMEFGFGMAFAVTLLLHFWLKTRKRSYLILALLGYVMIFMAGSRMALLLSPLYLFFHWLRYHIIHSHNRKDYLKLAMKVGVIVLAVVLLFVSAVLISQALIKSNKDFAKSRNLRMLAEGKIFDDNARSTIHRLVWKGIKAHPFVGLGAFGDRPLVAPYFIYGHSHSILYEIWSNFGILLGLPLILFIGLSVVAVLFTKKNPYGNLYLVFFSTSFLHLTSLSLWLEPYLWSYLTLFIMSPAFDAAKRGLMSGYGVLKSKLPAKLQIKKEKRDT